MEQTAVTPGVCPYCGNRADDKTTPPYFDNVEDEYTYCYGCGKHALNPRTTYETLHSLRVKP